MDIVLFIKAFRTPIISNRTFLGIIEKLSRRIESCLFNHADWIVTHGPMDYERIRKITERVTFVPLWIDTDKFRPILAGQASHLRRKFLKSDNIRVILFVGRLETDKSLETLLYATKGLSEVRKDVILVVIGTGSEEKRYIELARQLGITDKVKFLGYIRHDDVAEYYNIADVYVLTSMWEEWSNTIMEAMACGIPVIATNVGANPYLVKDGQTGFLFPVKNSQALAQKIAYVLDHQSEVKRISSEALLSMKKYTKQDIGESHKKVIRNVIFGQ
jgi:glycosyltransferase involved in cell wall biosynthesis